MSVQEPPREDVGRTLVIRIGAERVRELDRLANHLKRNADELAKEFLEAEIEAQHGLSFGPWLRKHMYR